MIAELTSLVERLEKAEIPYMITGGIALLLYTIPRSTQDIDVIVEIPKTKVENFIHAFSEGYYQNDEEVRSEIKREGMFNFIDLRTFFRIDFMILPSNAFERQKFSRRQKTNFEGVNLWVIHLDDLILSKLIWIQSYQSGKQIEDIKSLLSNPNVNFTYLKEWIIELKLNTFNLI